LSFSFEWDNGKAISNRRKHGVSFQTAIRAFADPYALSEQDRIVEGEQRWQTIGMVDGRLLLLVAHTLADDDDSEIVRIISAREANRRERRRYEEANGQIYG
jgi:uncharacterized DUF497 family protein